MMQGRRRRWSEEELVAAVASSTCLTDVIRALGLRPAGGSHASIKSHISRLRLSVAHFSSARRMRGVEGSRRARQRPDAEIFRLGSAVAGKGLRRAAVRAITPYQCIVCGNPGIHLGNPLTLQLHHLNGIFNDNRQANLAWVCPNCHSQTDGFAGRGSGSVRIARMTSS